MVLHSDSARAYKECKFPGVVKDHVVHKKRRVVGANGKARWLKPVYSTTVKHKLDGRVEKRRSGTQVIDRAWGFMKALIHKNQTTRPGSRGFGLEVRSAQWQYWTRGQDAWCATGDMIKALQG